MKKGWKINKYRILALSLCTMMLFGTGCGQNQLSDKDGGTVTSGEDKIANKNKAMGRYLENSCNAEAAFPEGTRAERLLRMTDGSLGVFDYNNGNLLISKDDAATWEAKKLDWYGEFQGKVYIMDVAVSPDGNVSIIYNKEEKEEADAAAGEDSEDTDAEENGLGTHDFTLHPVCMIFRPDGTRQEVTLDYSGDGYLERIQFAPDGRMFGSALDGKIYEINTEDGTCRMLAQLPGWGGSMAVNGNRLICAYGEGISIIDTDSGEVTEDKVLNQFVAETFGNHIEFNLAGGNSLDMLLQGDGSLYLTCEKGIFRYVIGGNVMEQIVDGALTSLGNPAMEIIGTLAEEDGSFYVLFTGNKLVHYVYDVSVSTVPDVQIKAYSLTDNTIMKLAIAQYQQEHPEAYVKYEVGMDGSSSVTREDALKKLNTEIVAGTGPDIMILDDMPLNSYIQKGLLLDLTPYLDEFAQNDTLFSNMTDAFGTEEGTYAVPVQFELPFIIGAEDSINQISDLETLTERIEEIRSRQPEGKILGTMLETELINKLIPVCAPVWKTEHDQNKIEEENLREFFTYAKRIWEAESAGITPEVKAEYENEMKEWSQMGMSDKESREYVLSLNGQIFQYLLGKQQLAAGKVASDFDFSTAISVFRVSGFEKDRFAAFNGQAKHVFIPKTIVGINAVSGNAEQAAALMKQMLSGENMMYQDAYPLNKAAFKDIFVNRYTESDELGSMAVSGGNGEVQMLKLKWPNEKEIETLYGYAEQAKIPYLRDTVLEDAVSETGEKVLRGDISTEEGIAEIKKKTAIYMAE